LDAPFVWMARAVAPFIPPMHAPTSTATCAYGFWLCKWFASVALKTKRQLCFPGVFQTATS